MAPWLTATRLDSSKQVIRRTQSVLNIAGHESRGWVGHDADMRVYRALNVQAISVLTCRSDQTSTHAAVTATELHAFAKHLSDVPIHCIDAVKVGLVVTLSQASTIVEWVSQNPSIPVIWDPVFVSSDGQCLAHDNPLEIIHILAPVCHLVTPNVLEAAYVVDGIEEAKTENDIGELAKSWQALGAKAVLIKGGHHSQAMHHQEEHFCSDFLSQTVSESDFPYDLKHHVEQCWLSLPRLKEGEATRATGCTLSAAIAAGIVLGHVLIDAVVMARMLAHQALRHRVCLNPDRNKAHSSVSNYYSAPQSFPRESGDLPYLSTQPLDQHPLAFPDCGDSPLGLYPIVDRAAWLTRLLPLGVTTIQLRIKDLQGEDLREELRQGIAIAKRYNARLFINDYWQLACELGAYGVHLGQEDLQVSDLQLIHSAGLRLGISTHCYFEVARAATIRPSYTACGPVFPTTSKDMPWVPQGLHGLNYWRELITTPVVAIGGISPSNIVHVARTGVDGIAMISTITAAAKPEDVTRILLRAISAGSSMEACES